MTNAAIETVGLGKVYPGGVRALDEVSFQTAYGEVFAYLGRNGSGKTTTIRILTTLTAATTGTARVAGHDVAGDPEAVRRAIGVTMQQAALDETMTGRELLRWLAALWKLPRDTARARVGEVVDRFGLGDFLDRRIVTYSGGTRRRLDLAGALLHRPQVLFLDEPTTGLDPRSRNGLWAVIRELVAEGTTLLLTTQYMEEADHLAGHIAVIDHGQVIAKGTPDELKAKIGGQVLEVRPANPAEVDRAAELLVELTGNQATIDRDIRLISVPMPDPAWLPVAVRRLDEAGIIVVDLALRRPSLDEVFLTLTGRPAEAEPPEDGAGHEKSAA